MAVTLAEARGFVRDRLNEPTAVFWTDAQLNTWINAGCLRIRRAVEDARSIDTYTVSAGQQDIVLNAWTGRMNLVEFDPSDDNINKYTLEFKGPNEMTDIWGTYKTQPGSWPTWFTTWGNPGGTVSSSSNGKELTISLFPVPTQSGTLNVWYYRQAVTATSDSDNIDMNDSWEDVVYDYAVYQAFKADGQMDRAQEAKQEFTTGMADLVDKSRTYTDLPGNFMSDPTNYGYANFDTDWNW